MATNSVREARHISRRLVAALEGWLTWLQGDILGIISGILLVLFIFLAAFGASLAPHGPFENMYHDDGRLVRLEPSSWKYPFGTNHLGQDILSQFLHATRVTVLVGVVAALCSVAIGTTVGLLTGYYGGWLDQILMRLADVAYSIPFLPFAILWVAIFGPSILNIVVVISLFLWRTTARVVRSQVFVLKERPFILAAKAAGATDLWIIWFQILPNVLPLSSLYVAFGAAWAILMEANLSFLGFGDPRFISWGQMLKVAFQAGVMRRAWWWVLPPGIALSLLVLSTFLVSRSYEEVVNPRLREM